MSDENKSFIEKYQPKTLEELKLPERIMNIILENSKRIGFRLLLYSTPGTGKCLGKDTGILMYDGSVKKVQDIVVGDKLAGINTFPRTVLSLARGREEMFKIIPKDGSKSWICNKSHILTLIEEAAWQNVNEIPCKCDLEDLSIETVLNLPENHSKKMIRFPYIGNPENRIDLSPYYLGLWLMDDNQLTKDIQLDENDKDFINEKLKIYSLLDIDARLFDYNLINNKHIPKLFLTSTTDTRKEIFTGLIDKAGTKINDTYVLTINNEQLKNDIIWLVKSLGLFVKTENNKLIFSGNFNDFYFALERNKFNKLTENYLLYDFDIESIGEDDYYGFEIDGDKHFLLEDFTVTHNTSTSRLITKGHNVLYLSGSNDFNIQTLREKVYTFANNFSVDNKQKTIIIDEAENIRNDLQDAFKIILDSAKSVNFIFITNEVQKMNDAIRSRCTNIEYNFNSQELKEQQAHYIKYAATICNAEGIKFDNSGLKELYKQHFPDFRHLLIVLQQLKDKNADLTEVNIKSIGEIGNQMIDLYEILESHLNDKEFYQKISAYRGKEKECLLALGEPFFSYLNEKELFEKTLQAAVINSDYSNKILTTINKFSTFFSCCIELRNIFNK